MTKLNTLGSLALASFASAWAATACVGDEPAAAPSEDAGTSDTGAQSDGNVTGDSGSSEAGPACSPTGAFGAPVEIPSLHVPGAAEFYVTFSGDGLSALITRQLPGASSANLYLADRGSTIEDFPSGTLLGPEVNGDGLDGGLSGAGRGTFADAKMTIFFEAKTPGPNNVDIYTASRDSTSSTTFHPRTTVPQFFNNGDHGQPYLVKDSLYSFFNPGGAFQIQETHRGGSGFDAPQHLANLDNDSQPVVTLDEKTILVANGGRVYEAHRDDPGGAFGVPTEISSAVSTGHEAPSDVSPDGCILYFTRGESDGGSERRVFMSTRSK